MFQTNLVLIFFAYEATTISVSIGEEVMIGLHIREFWEISVEYYQA